MIIHIISNECSTIVGSNTVFFDFTYDSTEQSFGYKDENGNFVPFSSGGTDVSDTTATADKVLSGYYFYGADGTRTQGTYVALDTSDATATSKRIESGYTAYVKGVKITGSAYIEHNFGKFTNSIPSLSTYTYGAFKATSTTNYAIISSEGSNHIFDCYNSVLTKSTINDIAWNDSNYTSSCNRVNGYAICLGGYSTYRIASYSINDSLTMAKLNNLNALSDGFGTPTYNSNYALFCATNYQYVGNVLGYDTSLTLFRLPSDLSFSPRCCGSFNDNMLFTGLSSSDTYYHTESYDNNLTKTVRPNITQLNKNSGDYQSGWSSSNAFSINGFGYVSSGNVYGGNAVVYDNSFVLSQVNMSGGKRPSANGSSNFNFEDHCVILDINSGTYSQEYTGIYNVYDNSLTCTQGTLNNRYTVKAKASVGIYNLVAGGEYYPYSGASYSYSTTVEAFYES